MKIYKLILSDRNLLYLIYSGHISLKLRPHTDSDGVVVDLIIIPDLSLFQDFPPTLRQIESPFMAETLLSTGSGREFGGFHFDIINFLFNILQLSWMII